MGGVVYLARYLPKQVSNALFSNDRSVVPIFGAPQLPQSAPIRAKHPGASIKHDHNASLSTRKLVVGMKNVNSEASPNKLGSSRKAWRGKKIHASGLLRLLAVFTVIDPNIETSFLPRKLMHAGA